MIAPLLSHNTRIGSKIEGTTTRSVMNFFNQIASLAASHGAMYSASVMESAVVVCFELFQEIVPRFKVNINLDLDLLSSGSD